MTIRRYIHRGLLACIVTGAIPALIDLIFRGIGGSAFFRSALSGFVFAACIALPCAIAIPGLLSRMGRRSLQAKVLAVTGVLALFCVTGCLVASLILGAAGLVRGPGAFWWNLKICLSMTFTFGAVSIVVAALYTNLRRAQEALHARDLAAAEARFASLESRIRPHFLFNTLNSISALVRENPPEAERTIERLAALLRFSLDSEVAGVVTLAEEMRIVQDYLEIEKVRFGGRLRYRLETQPAASGRLIPALAVQTLVENSVKYAVGSRDEGAEIEVVTRLENATLVIEVSDDGPGFDTVRALPRGHGLDLLQRRLTSLPAASASLAMRCGAGRTRVTIYIAA